MSTPTISYPDTVSVPKSTLVYQKVKEGESGYHARRVYYRAQATPPSGKSYKDATKAQQLWQAHQDAKNNNMLYFVHPGTKETVWVLPDLELVDGAGKQSTTPSKPSATANDDTASNASSAASIASSADAIKKAIQEKLAAKMSAMKSGSSSSVSATAPSPAPGMGTTTTTTTSGASKPPLAVDTSATNATTARTPRSASGGGGSSWRDRIAERRGKSPSTPTSSPLNPAGSSDTTGSQQQRATPTQNQQQQQQSTTSPSPSEQSRYSERKKHLSNENENDNSNNEHTAHASSSSDHHHQTTSTIKPPSPSVTFNEQAVVSTYEQEAESAKIKAAKLELQLQQRRLLQAQQEEAHQRELEEMQQKRREAEARRLELEMDRVKLLSEKKTRQEQMLAKFHHGDPEEARANAQLRLQEAREEAKKQFISQIRDRDGNGDHNNSVTPVRANDLHPASHHHTDPVVPPVDTRDLEEEVAQRVIDYGKNFTYTGGTKKDKPTVRHGRGLFQYGSKDSDTGRHTTYDGEWRNHFKNGWGTMNLPTSMYEGDWLNDKMHGKGTLRTRQMQATAPFQKGVAHGNGAVVQVRGHGTFQGPVRNNKAGESGQMRIPVNSSNNAHHQQGKKSPSASRSSTAGGKKSNQQQQQHLSDHPLGAMEVEWKWSDASAPGTGEACATFADGNVYVGSMRNYTLSGPGRLIFASTGDEYLGDFQNNVMEGKGLYRFAVDGSVYEGQMRDGSFNGIGTFATPTFLYEGEWRDGQMHGKGRIKYENGDVWEGTFENHRRSEGSYTFSSVFALEEAVAVN